MSKEDINNVLNNCNDKVKHIKSANDRTREKKMCIGKQFNTNKETSDIFQKLMQCILGGHLILEPEKVY